MLSLDLSAIAGWTSGRLMGRDVNVCGVSTDTRKLLPGELFVALRGERHDAHDFVAAARERGAAALLVSRSVDCDLPQVVVADTERALGALAGALRLQRRAKVVGITGSNGKTTVKTLTAAILSRAGLCHVNAGNLNNEIGLPLSLLALPEQAEFAVLEMGAGKPGDIAYLADIAKPDVGLVNNVAPAHLARLGNVDGVAETKGAIYSLLPPDGIAIINADDAFAGYFASLAGSRRIVRFGLDHLASVHVEALELKDSSRFVLVTPAGRCDVQLPLAGRHNVQNALAAAAIAFALNVSMDAIKAGLENAPGVVGRLTRYELNGWSLIDDSYNANPGSMAAAIATLAQCAGERWLIIGDMAELGPDAERLHAAVGALAKRSAIQRLLAVGPLSRAAVDAFGPNGEHYADQASLTSALKASIKPGLCCLVKGSRSSAMDRVVAALLAGGIGNGGTAHAA